MAVKFDFRRRLGSGNFGEVWLAVETGLDSNCAVKIVPPDRVAYPGNFFAEAQTLKAVEHSNVVKIFDTGVLDDGRIYVSMEYLRRGSLEDEASGAYVPLSRVKRIMVDALRGLDHAHQHGILHRDIKPSNILVGDNKEGKLADFGLALPAGTKPFDVGMKGYLYTIHTAPEIHAGSSSSVATEIYSAGVTLYRLVNGDTFVTRPADVLNEIQMGGFPDRSKYRDFVPRSFRMVINRAMSLDPSQRFESATDLRHAIEQLEVRINWNEVMLSDGMRWTGSLANDLYEITKTRDRTGQHSVRVRRGRSLQTLRNVNQLSRDGLLIREAHKYSASLLQAFVAGRLP